MPLITKNLQPIGGQPAAGISPQVWGYATLDTHATVDTSGYFNGVASLLRAGDIIDVVVWATAIGTGTVSTYGRHVVLSISALGVVNTSDVTVGVVTNTD